MKLTLKQKLEQLPSHSGVYVYYDATGKILYVGKAKNLKNRVRQYFSSSYKKAYKVEVMLTHVADMDYVLTESETDAFALENTLIKKYSPPFNILLKDDKQYPFVKIFTKERYPRVTMTRKVVKDKAKYFGPVTGSIKELLELLNELYPTRTCNLNFDNIPANFRPCLNFHLGTCSAPCVGKISEEDYSKLIDKCCALLRGDTAEALKAVAAKMTEASDKMQYEQALKYRRQLELLQKLSETKVATLGRVVDYDVFTVCCDGTKSAVNTILVRGGRIVCSKSQTFTDAGIDEAQTLAEFIYAYYESTNDIAKIILINKPIEGGAELAEYLSEKFEKKVAFNCPQKGERKKLVDMSLENAIECMKKSVAADERKYAATTGAVTQLKELLGLKNLPQRIECYDISNVSGVDKVASMVVAVGGSKAPKEYRRFKIKTVEGANDFASMKETLLRRFERLKKQDYRFGAPPDLIVVDGGMGQLKYAVEARDESGVEVEIVSLAKREELVYVEGDNQPRRLPRDSYALNLLINTRDEAHRFAITYFRKLHGKNAFVSELESIEGIGKKRLIALQKKFKNIQAIKDATVEDLAATEGISKNVAENIKKYFEE
ncbi:MAG: excinuclease ABC subunit UvrC [Eubacteriales bacterium]|nr:excinuclease ABC subunit UvrC [Eubacteriales bacterium]